MRRAVVILVASMLVACGGSSLADVTLGPPGGTTNPTGLAGTYTLKTVDGKALPAASGDSTFLSGRIVLTDTTWNQIIVVRYAAGGSGTAAGDSLMEAGRWTTSNGKISLLEAGSNEIYTGTLTSGGFSLTTKTSTLLVYSK
jgi:hypothetical protein